jgi:uncharacterized protein
LPLFLSFFYGLHVTQDILKKSAAMGVGIGLRRPHYNQVLDTPASDTSKIGWLELLAENFMKFGGRPRHVAIEVSRRWPVACHGVGLNLGSLDSMKEDYLRQLRSFVQLVKPVWFSDHLCFTTTGTHSFHDLIPVPRTRQSVENLTRRIQQARDAVGVAFAVENVSMYVDHAEWEYTEAQFIAEIVDKSECLLLLDINNIYVNCVNHGWDPEQYLNTIPLQNVVQVHLAGHWNRGDILIDTHGESVCEPVWDLYRTFLKKAQRPVATLIEWDNDIPTLAELVAQADRARAIIDEVFHGTR